MPVRQPKDFWQEVQHAEEYEDFRFKGFKGGLYRLFEERAIAKALRILMQGSRILDVPAGTGRITLLLMQQGHSLIASDIALPMMTVARNTRPQLREHVPFVQSDIHRLPFANGTFDAVVCVGLLMHQEAQDRHKTLTELSRVTRRFILLQYGCEGGLLRLKTMLTGRNPGNVRFPLRPHEIAVDLSRCGLTEITRSWVLRPMSSSLILLAEKAT